MCIIQDILKYSVLIFVVWTCLSCIELLLVVSIAGALLFMPDPGTTLLSELIKLYIINLIKFRN